MVIVTVALLEQALEDAILSHCTPMEESDKSRLFGSEEGSISAFAAKVELGYALGVYGKSAREDLTTIRRIRNAFAHTKRYLDFTIPEIADLCHFNLLGKVTWWEEFAIPPITARTRFLETVRTFALYLDEDEHIPKDWATSKFGDLFG